MLSFECERCGDCCKGAAWLSKVINPADIEKWKAQGREDILKYLCACGNSLVDPDKDNVHGTKKSCPFLEFEEGKAKCQIYEMRPQVCKDFPIQKCNDPECPENFHFHSWLWNGKCAPTKKFREDMVHAVESQINI